MSRGPTGEFARRCKGAGKASASRLAVFRVADLRFFRRLRAMLRCSRGGPSGCGVALQPVELQRKSCQLFLR